MKILDNQDSFRIRHLRRIVEAARRIHSAMDAIDANVCERLGVHRSDLRCLNLLEHGPRSASELGARLSLTSGAVTALIDRLEAMGFVERRRSPDDRRRVEVAIAPTRFEMIGALYREVALTIMERFAEKETEELENAVSILDDFATTLSEAEVTLHARP